MPDKVKLVHVSHVSGDLYVLRPFHATDPGYGQGGVPHPGHELPGGHPAFPDNSLPSHPPPHVPEGTVVVLVKDPAGVWHYASLPPGTPVPTPLPEPTPEPKAA